MFSRLPPISNSKPHRSPSNRKENLDSVLSDKRRKITAESMVAPASNTRSRQVLSTINSDPAAAAQAGGSDAGGNGAALEIGSREEVDCLLSEKMKVKNKNDYKGKSEQMTEYIKKLKTCIKWFMEREDMNLMEQEKLKLLLGAEGKRHAENESQMSKNLEEMNASNEELKGENASLVERLRIEGEEKMAVKKSYDEEKSARAAAESSLNVLSEELRKAALELKCLGDEIKMLQSAKRRSEEYICSLQQFSRDLQAEVKEKSETISKLQNEKNAMVESLNMAREKQSSLKCQLEASKISQQEALKQKEELKLEVCSHRSELQLVREDRDQQLAHVQSLTAQIADYKDLTGKSAKELDDFLTRTTLLEGTCSSQRERIENLQHQLAAANERMAMANLSVTETITEYEGLKKTVSYLQTRLADAEQQLVEAEKLRKKLHNTILELKGNIRVFCRVRPILPDCEINGSEGAVVSYPTATESLGRGIDLMHNAQTYSFTFDKVFSQEASQGDVFVEISQLVQSALDGYKVSIFAYGQTGSGKTYTMMGKAEAEQKGLIPRSLEQVFETSQCLQSQGWKFKMQASMLEIYNETIRDLLTSNGATDAISAPSKQYAIKHDSNGNTYVSDLTVVDVCSIKEVSYLLKKAAQSRSVGRTHMNEQSSRSHFVFTLRIFGTNEITEQQVQGVLNLIDLAGSERLARSGATGDRLKETQAINKSLATLSDVIFAIAKKDEHVPFRNSKLTYLLQPCLGGDSKTLMFVNVSPEPSSANETICSLRFAARVNSCEIGVPRRHTQMRQSESRLSYG